MPLAPLILTDLPEILAKTDRKTTVFVEATERPSVWNLSTLLSRQKIGLDPLGCVHGDVFGK